jgi:hypothetical protein
LIRIRPLKNNRVRIRVAIQTAKELGSGAMKLPARGPKSTVDKVMVQQFSIEDPDNFDVDPTSEKKNRVQIRVATQTAKELGSGAMKLPARGPKSTMDKVMFNSSSISGFPYAKQAWV